MNELKVRIFKDMKLNKYLAIVIILAILGTVLISLKLAHGQSDNMTMNQTTGLAENQTEVQRGL